MTEINTKAKELIKLYVRVYLESKQEEKVAIEELKSHSFLTDANVGCYINSSDITDDGVYSGGYADIKYLGVAYNVSSDNFEVNYDANTMPVGIDVGKWLAQIENRLRNHQEKDKSKLEDFYLNSGTTENITIQKTVEVEKLVFDKELKTKADILDNLLSRSELILKK